MAVQISKKHITSHITTGLDKYSDGLTFTVMETGYTSTSEKSAIQNARTWLRKAWTKYLRLENRKKGLGKFKKEIELPIEPYEEKEKITRKRTKKAVKKLKKSVRIKRKRIFVSEDQTLLDMEEVVLRRMEDKLAKKVITPKLMKKRIKRRRTK
jgi:DNA-binding SARP family transcriptional activator